MLTTESVRRPPIYYGYWLIGAAFIAQFVSVGTQNYVVGPFMTPMIDELGWTRAEFTIPRALGQFFSAFVGFLIGSYVDRYGGKAIMLIGVILLSVSLVGLGRVETLWQWVVLNGLVLTIGSAMIGSLVVNVTLAKWFVELRGRAVAVSAMGVSFAGVLLTPLMTWVIDEWGWRIAWQVLAVGSATLVVPVALLMRRAPEDHGLHPDGKTDRQVAAGEAGRAAMDYATSLTRPQALRTSAFYLLVAAFGMFGLTIGVMLLQTVPFMTDAGYGRTTAALMITVASVPAMLSKPLWGYLIDKLNPKRLAATGAVLTGSAMIVIVVSVAMRSDPFIYVGFFVLGCGWGGMIPLQEVIWAAFFGRRYLGAVRSMALPFSLIIGAGAPLAVSYYYDVVGDYDGAFLTVAAMNLIAAALLLLLPDPYRRLGQ